MCLGAIGDAVQSLDKAISGPLLDPMKKAGQWVSGNTVGKMGGVGAELDNVFDKVGNHPLETAATAAAAYYSGGLTLGAEGLFGAADASAAGTAGAGAATDVGAGSAGAAGAGSTTVGAATESSAAGSAISGFEGLGKALAPVVLSSLLAPKPPKTKAPTAMPDPLAQQQAQQQKLLAQLARRGRSSTILTSPGNGGGSLGG